MSRTDGPVLAAKDLQAFGIFAGLEEAQLASIAATAHLELVPEGVEVLREGEEADAVRLLQSGRVTVSLLVPGHGETVLSTLSRGQMLGFSALLPHGRWIAGARSVKPCSLLVLPRDGLLALCEATPAIGYRLMRNALESVAGRLRDARLQLLDIFSQPAESS